MIISFRNSFINGSTMKQQTAFLLIRIAGYLTILFTLFHAGFYWIFHWSETLACMNATDRGILLTFNLTSVILLVYSVILSLGYTAQLIETVAGKSVLLFFSSFYLARIYSEFAYFGFKMPGSIVIIVTCLIPAVCFGAPVFLYSQTKTTNVTL